VEADAQRAYGSREAFGSSGSQRGGTVVEGQQAQGDGSLEEIAEASGVAGPGSFEVFLDLAAELSAFLDRIATVSNEELKGPVKGIDGGLGQGEAGDGGGVEGDEVGVVGLDAGIAWLSVVFGGVGVNGADVVAGGGEGALGDVVVASGAFDGDDEVGEAAFAGNASECGDGVVEFWSSVFDGGRWDENVAVEISELPLEACLGAINGDDAEVFGPGGLDTGVDDASGFGEDVTGATARSGSVA
jgi:hypothetical protein